MVPPRVLVLLISCVLVLPGITRAARITWTLPLGFHQSSQGTALDTTYLFEVGSFAPSFTPGSSNRTTWATNWTPLSRLSYDPSGPTKSTESLFNNEGAFAIGQQAYAWGFNIDQPTREWVLLTNLSWTWPDANSSATPEWIVDQDTQAIFGTVTNGTLTTSPSGLASDPVITATEWKSANFVAPALLTNPNISGWEADPDADGLNNLFEMALGSNPLSNNSKHLGLPSGTIFNLNGRTFVSAAFTKTPNRYLHYDLELSNDQELWLTNQVALSHNDLREIAGQSLVPLAPSEAQFLRVSVTIPTP